MELPRVANALRVPMEAFSAEDITVRDPWCAQPSDRAAEALRFMKDQGFDAAPIEEQPISRFVDQSDLRPGVELVDEAAGPITANLIVSNNLALVDTIRFLGRSPYLFVLFGRRGIDGIITRADLQRPPVALLVLSLLLTAEASLRDIVARTIQDWDTSLGPDALANAEQRLEERRRHNTELELVDCLTFGDRLRLIRKSPELVESLGFSSTTAYREWEKRVKRLRDNLAHAGNLLEAEPDSLKAIALVEEVLQFANSVCHLAESDRSHPA